MIIIKGRKAEIVVRNALYSSKLEFSPHGMKLSQPSFKAPVLFIVFLYQLHSCLIYY